MAQDSGFQEKQGEVYCNINQNKKEDWHPDYTSQITLPDGQRYYIDVWDGIGKNSGQPYRRVRIGNPVTGGSAGTQAPVQNTQSAHQAVSSDQLNELEDDLPF
jgi:hypothetical protein